jgi:uncharacterized membrane protein/Mg-chelatase subunit ChlD
MLPEFGRPAFLLLLPVVLPAVLLLARRGLAGLPPVRRFAAVALRALVVLLLVLAAAEMKLVRKDDRVAVIYAVDVSASIPPEHRQAAIDYAIRSSSRRDPVRGDSTGLIVFGKNAGIEISPRPEVLRLAGLNTVIEKDFTDIAGAIRLSAAVFPEGSARRIVLLSDGNENRGRALEEARAARDRGVEVDVIPISFAYPAEVLVDKVVVDPEVHVGEPFDVRVVVESTKETRVVLRLFENGTAVHAQEVDLKPGKNVFVVPRRLDLTDRYVYEALIEPLAASDDAVLQNNGASAFTFIRGEPKVLVCSKDPEADRSLVEALKAERINAAVVRPDGLPGEIDEYIAYQAIILSNVPAHLLSEDQLRLFEGLVKGVGLGFVMIGGDDGFGAGGWQGTPVEALLPVWMEIKQKKVLPNGALAIVMHSCEIDNGNYWAKQTVQQAIRVLSPRDYAGVLFYDHMGGEKWLFPMTPCSQKGMMLSRLASFAPGDMPDFSRIVSMAHQGLKSVPASIRHIIILSDGDPQKPTAGQIAAIRKDGITISTICMGWHSNPVEMKLLAQAGGGQYYPLTDPNKLPSIFIREASTIRKSLISERDFTPIVRGGASFLRGIDLGRIPQLKGYVIATQKESADGELVAPPDTEDPTLDPILSSWTYGLGKSVAFTSDSGSRWGVHWKSWEDYRKFWSQVVRWVARDQGEGDLRSSRVVEGDTGVLAIDAVDRAGNFLNGMVFEGNVVDPDFKSGAVDARQVGPGRYRAEFPVAKKGTYIASFRFERDGRTYIYSTGLSVPYSPEYRKLATDEDLLGRIAAATSGKVLDPADSAAPFLRDFPPARSSSDIWRDLVRAAAILFFLDIFVRRVAVDWRRAYRTAAAWAAERILRRKREAAAPDERLQTLLRRKGEVRAAQDVRKRTFEAPAGAAPKLDESFIAGGGAAKAAAPVRAPAPEPKKEAPAAPKPAAKAEESYTSRLLAAKRRARDKKS